MKRTDKEFITGVNIYIKVQPGKTPEEKTKNLNIALKQFKRQFQDQKIYDKLKANAESETPSMKRHRLNNKRRPEIVD